MNNIFNPQINAADNTPSPRVHRNLQALDGSHHSPRSQSLVQEREVLYFYYNSEKTQQDTLETRLTRLFKNLPYASKIKNQSSPECRSKARKTFPRAFKICFEIYEKRRLTLPLNPEIRRLFADSLPYIDFIELGGDQGIMLFSSLMRQGHDFYEEIIRDSSFRLLVRAPLDHENAQRLAHLFRENLFINPNLIKEIAFENQSLNEDSWRHLLSALQGENPARECRQKGKVILANCSWTHVAEQSETIISYNSDLTMGQKLSDFIDALPSWLAEIDIRSSLIDMQSLLNNPVFIQSCHNYSQRSNHLLTISLPPTSFKTLTAEDIDSIVALELQNTLSLNNIFLKISWFQLVDYLWHLQEPDNYEFLLEKYDGNKVAEIHRLPSNLDLFAAFIDALPKSFCTIKIMLPSLNFQSLLSCSSLITALRRYSISTADKYVSLEVSDITNLELKLGSLHKILELYSSGMRFIGIAKHISPRLWAEHFLTQENSSLQVPSINIELLSHESRQAIECYFDPESQRCLQNLPFGNQSFVLSDIAPKSSSCLPTSLLSLLLKTQLPSGTRSCLQQIGSKDTSRVDWSCEFSTAVHIAIKLWRYALTQECSLSLEPQYIKGMLSKLLNSFEPATRYGSTPVGFEALPKIIIDMLSQRHIDLIEKILIAFKHSLESCADYKTKELLYPFSLDESHDISADISRPGILRKHQEEQNALKKRAKPVLLTTRPDGYPLHLQVVFTPK